MDRPRGVGTRPRLFCFPSADTVFRRVAEGFVDSLALLSPRRLEDALRPAYPHAIVHPRELSGERIETWYVYRERTFPAGPDHRRDS